ncbi:hypothetical protein D9756_006932 [Leucocoprinus leucothites]|uniref:DUF6535 domain-containing protein n=1 Tax=Leucocoprinus leucothites TaxID=201217 RepID=A0A8H5D754_9AGAR|nr:hypothetical protein D9756_006932 [Leucoagaricus leucothites]
MDDGLLGASQRSSAARLSLSSEARRRVSSTYTRSEPSGVQDQLDEQEGAGRRSYEYIKRANPTFTGAEAQAQPRLSKAYNNPKDYIDPWRCGEKYQYGGSPEAASGSWQKCHRLVKRYDDDMCDAWREEVDKLLIFAGLFSATITAFTIESYKWLQVESDDLSSAYLYFLATQYAQSHNTSLPSFLSEPWSNTDVSHTAIRINVFWFLSLTLSLTTVLIGILCLQWLREFQRSSSPLPPKSSLALRQMRYSGLMAWRVPQILSVLPLLLQTSLLLFFAGLLDLLWDRNPIVASVISAAVGLVVGFLGATTALPALQFVFSKDEMLRGDQCPYKSPQSWLFLRIAQFLFRLYQKLRVSWTSGSIDWAPIHRVLKSITDMNWSELDMRWRMHRDATSVSWGTPKAMTDASDIVDALEWVNNTFGTSSIEAILPLYHSLAGLSIPASSRLILSLYQGTPFEATTFRVMMDDRFSPTETQKREIISTFYLHLHESLHGGVVKPFYIESVVRILNSQEVPVPFLDWLSTILQEIADLVQRGRLVSEDKSIDVGERTLGKARVEIVDAKILVQIIGCVASLAANNSRRPIDIVNTWILLDTLLWNTVAITSTTAKKTRAHGFSSEHRKSLTTINTQHTALASNLFQNLKTWVSKNTREIDLQDRLEVCMEGLMLIFPDYLTEDELRALDNTFIDVGFIASAGDLVRVLAEEGKNVGAVPGVMRGQAVRMDKLHPLQEASGPAYHVGSPDICTSSLDRWWNLVGKFSALQSRSDNKS